MKEDDFCRLTGLNLALIRHLFDVVRNPVSCMCTYTILRGGHYGSCLLVLLCNGLQDIIFEVNTTVGGCALRPTEPVFIRLVEAGDFLSLVTC